MKKALILCLILLLGFASVAMAAPVWLAGKGTVDAEPIGNAVRYTFTHADAKDTWHAEQVAFCPDPLREGCDGNIPFHFIKKDGNTMTWDIPMEVVKGGQSATNWANDEQWLNALWLGLPDCQNLTVGKNLIYYKSIVDPGIPKSGGMHLLYVGPGAPFVPQSGDPRIYTCGSTQRSSVVSTPASAVTMVAKPKQRKRTDGSICTEPCIEEIKQNTREIKADVKDIKESVGPIDKTEPADEQTVQQKTRKTLSTVKSIDRKIGESKRKGGTVHGTLDRVHQRVEDIATHLKVSDATACITCHKEGATGPALVAPAKK